MNQRNLIKKYPIYSNNFLPLDDPSPIIFMRIPELWCERGIALFRRMYESAFIRSSVFANAPETKISIRKRIGQIFTDSLIRVNPRHPRYPCSIVALLSEHFHTTIQEYNYKHRYKQNNP